MQKRAVRQLFGKRAPRILAGPFQGMQYPNRVVWGPIPPKWYGSYECELHEVLESVIALKPRAILDIGAADGYYAVGMAKRLPESDVYAYDTDPISRLQTKTLAKLNQTSVEARGFCTAAEMTQRIIADSTFILCDIEGHEMQTLDPVSVPKLSGAHILVEMHGTVKSAQLNAFELMERFGNTHRGTIILPQPREEWVKKQLNPADISLLNECRGEPQCWVWLEPLP
jgi:hypothetical protein